MEFEGNSAEGEVSTVLTESPELKIVSQPQETEEIPFNQENEYIQVTQEINSQIPQGENVPPINKEQVSKVVEENKEKPTVLDKFHEFGIFKKSETWKDAFNNEIKPAVIEYEKERFMIGLVVAGIAVALIEPTPIMECLIGPVLVKTGYEKSKYLKKIIPEILLSKFNKADPIKAFSKAKV